MFDFRKKKPVIEEPEDDYVDLTSIETEETVKPIVETPKPIETKPSGLSSVQVSIEFKEQLKKLKGSMSYEEYIKKLMNKSIE